MGNYKKLIFLFLVTVFGGNFLVIGQVKIGGNPSIINANSALEIEASDKGLLLPRIALASTTSVAPLTNTVVAGMTVYNTATNGDVMPGFYYYNGAKWIRVADAAAGTVTASNGLIVSGNDVKLGGALVSPTIITTDATNTLTLAGLQTGQDTDDLITTNAAGMLTRSPKSTVPTIYTADGTLTNSRRVTQGANSLTFDGTSVTGGSTTFDNNSGSSIRVFAKDDTGRANVTLATNITSLDSSINGGAAQIIANGSTDFSIGTGNASDLSFSTAGSQQLRISGATGKVFLEKNLVIYSNGATNTSGLQLYELKNTSPETAGAGAIGVDGGGNVVRVPVISSSSNGLTTTAGDVKLGGTLTTPTTVTTDVTNTLALSGLQTGAATDAIITADAITGVLTKSAKSSLPNIYTADGTLSASRTVSLEDKYLRFDGDKGSISFDNYSQGSLSVIGKAVSPDLRAASFDLRAGATSLTSTVNEGSFAQITANGAAGLSISTIGASGLSFSTNSQGRMSISDTGLVGVVNSVEINNVSGANDTSGLKLAKLKSTSPESTGGAIGVNASGDVVRVPVLISSSNGLTTVTGEVKLGGTLTESTTITQGTNSLTFDGTSGTGGTTTFDNNIGSSIRVFAKEDNGRANVTLATNIASLDSSLNGGVAQILANGSSGFSLGTTNAARLGFNTDNSERMSISPVGKVLIENNMVIYSTNGGAGTSGLQFYELRSSSPESVGGAIGVDQNGNVVRIGSANNPFSNKTGSPVVIGATGAVPSKATAPENDFIRYRELGNNQVEVDFMYSSAASAGAVNGTGDYLFTLPNGYSFNGGENNYFGGAITGLADLNGVLPYALRDVKAVFIGSGGTSAAAYVIPYSATQFRLVGVSTGLPVSDTYSGMAGTKAVYGGRFIFVKQ